MIVSMGEIKIKNYLVKNYNAIKEATNVAFHTEEDAKTVLEWIKQKVFETTLIGTEKIEAEIKQKQEANRQKRLNKEAEKTKTRS
jgi:aspartyl aminopeptidase